MSKALEALNNLVQSCFNPCNSDEVLNDKAIVEKSLKALEIIKKLFNPKEYNFLELYENPFITIGEKGEKYRIDSTDDSYIHIGIPKEEFNLLKEVLE